MSVKEIAKVLKKVGNLIIEWRGRNTITYDMAKIELILFFWARQQYLN